MIGWEVWIELNACLKVVQKRPQKFMLKTIILSWLTYGLTQMYHYTSWNHVNYHIGNLVWWE
jgi:hypothetical protein